MTNLYNLKPPNETALLRSKMLSDTIHAQINAQGGKIPFADFMETVLYHPELGYYTNKFFTLGAQGDFTTAPEISPLFAKCFAKQCSQVLPLLPQKAILELGAGTGHFAHDLLVELDQQNCLPSRYFIYEKSMSLREQQYAYLTSTCPFFDRIRWLDDLPAQFVGIILANEVLDALPVHGFRIEPHGIYERCVGSEQGEFVWHLRSPTRPELNDKICKIRDLYFLNPGYESEINLTAAMLIHSLANSLLQGVMFLTDYGYGQPEYYNPQRNKGTLTCFYQHHYHDNPLIFPGLQDITAHVDFTQVAESALEQGCSLVGYTSQAAFLFACGLMEFAAEEERKLSPAEQFDLHQAIKLLTFPTEMGERIKVMALAKHIEAPLLGFAMQDRRRGL